MNVAFRTSLYALVPCVYLAYTLEKRFAMVLPAECNRSLDNEFYFEPELVYQRLTCMGDAGRSLYLDFYKFDFIFPFVYSTFLYGALNYLWPDSNNGMAVFGVVTGFCDLVENMLICFALAHLPTQNDGLASAIAFISKTKWRLGFMSLAMVFAGVVRMVGNGFKVPTVQRAPVASQKPKETKKSKAKKKKSN
ncbi:hypothetical protein Poli38472_012923 [Pythium oligandrum]|uniref:Uncharacterized protein n=1 Tax=Pythium oligandrum TaxID=41045 RepID=A0A8K1CKB6_PYTOL|nr:hypothetical protein Poli38472_012923 [Pythium oligandrum]|eukprot:TMW64301.1 hypothetical protein Poli38472_012923 [Pythium oligandrum]